MLICMAAVPSTRPHVGTGLPFHSSPLAVALVTPPAGGRRLRVTWACVSLAAICLSGKMSVQLFCTFRNQVTVYSFWMYSIYRTHGCQYLTSLCRRRLHPAGLSSVTVPFYCRLQEITARAEVMIFSPLVIFREFYGFRFHGCLLYFELMLCMCKVRIQFNSVSVDIQFSQHYLLMRPSFSHCVFSIPLLKIS